MFLFVIGSNTTEAHPVLALRMKKAVRKGAKLVVADPRKIWLTKLADRHLQLRPGIGRLADQRDDARDHRRGPAGRGVHPRAHRRLRGSRGCRQAVHAGGGRADDRRSGRGHPLDGARVCAREARGDLLHPGDHRARERDRQHLVAQQPHADDRPPRLRVDRPQRAARAKQRAGTERRRREPDVLPRLPADQRRSTRQVRGGVGRRSCPSIPATGSTRSSRGCTTTGSRRSI